MLIRMLTPRISHSQKNTTVAMIDTSNMSDFSQELPKSLQVVTQAYMDSSSTYRAQNAFGAEVTVSSQRRSAYGFAVINWNDFRFIPTNMDSDKYRVSFNASLPPTKARRLENKIRALFVGYVTAPYQTEDADGHSATFSEPYADYTSFSYICLRLKEVVFFDGESGYILGRVLPKGYAQSASPTKSFAHSTPANKKTGSKVGSSDTGYFFENAFASTPPQKGERFPPNSQAAHDQRRST